MNVEEEDDLGTDDVAIVLSTSVHQIYCPKREPFWMRMVGGCKPESF